MHETDYLNLDGRLLRVFDLVYETGSVSDAARRLGVNQSSVSHALERLRRIVGDPLFVRAGRGIAPTTRADALAGLARAILAEMERFAEGEAYDPQKDQRPFTIAANDYEVETVLRPLLSALRADAPMAPLHIVRVYSKSEWAKPLRNKELDLVLAPVLESDEADLAQQTLFQDRHMCFFDPMERSAPETLDAYCAAPHAVMSPGRFRSTEIDRRLEEMGRRRTVVLAAPSFSMLAALIKGTNIVAAMPSRLTSTLFAGFSCSPPPFQTAAFNIAQIWHIRNSASLRHRWLRDRIRACAVASAPSNKSVAQSRQL